MHSDVYRRLYATCLTMSEQSNSPDVRARWLALAQDCENRLKLQVHEASVEIAIDAREHAGNC